MLESRNPIRENRGGRINVFFSLGVLDMRGNAHARNERVNAIFFSV